jgi:hypothetical protein
MVNADQKNSTTSTVGGPYESIENSPAPRPMLMCQTIHDRSTGGPLWSDQYRHH